MITLKSEVEVEIYISVSGKVCISHGDELSGGCSVICMTKGRAIELAKAIRKVASKAVENGES